MLETKRFVRLWPVLIVAIVITIALIFSISMRPSNGAGVTLELVAQGLTSPVHLVSAQDGTGRLFIVDLIGVVRVLMPDGSLLSQPFLDIRDQMVPINPGYDERGLLGLAFHPNFAQNGRVFVHYSAPLRPDAPRGWDHTGQIVEFTVSADNPNVVDHNSQRLILTVDQPQSNHNGGMLAFGPDGYLYIALGDGGGANDTGVGHAQIGNGQDTTTLLGKILRIDVDRPSVAADSGAVADAGPYGIPSDNPFVDGGGRSEIYAWGFRNPFRFSFDRGGERHLYVADVGQSLLEEINIVTGPGNYGWPIKEGSLWFDRTDARRVVLSGPIEGPMGEPLAEPIIVYTHPGVALQGLSTVADGGTGATFASNLTGIAIVGGYVYRGNAIADLQGKYVFGDWSRSFRSALGQLFVATPPSGADESWTTERIMDLNEYVLGFGEDEDGEIYVLTTQRVGPSGTTGKVYKIVASQRSR